MFAKKCDRCGALFEIYNTKNNAAKPNGYMALSIDEKGQYWSYQPKDLCPMCMDKFLNFMQGRKED